jgi:hypothetical protein
MLFKRFLVFLAISGALSIISNPVISNYLYNYSFYQSLIYLIIFLTLPVFFFIKHKFTINGTRWTAKLALIDTESLKLLDKIYNHNSNYLAIAYDAQGKAVEFSLADNLVKNGYCFCQNPIEQIGSLKEAKFFTLTDKFCDFFNKKFYIIDVSQGQSLLQQKFLSLDLAENNVKDISENFFNQIKNKIIPNYVSIRIIEMPNEKIIKNFLIKI